MFISTLAVTKLETAEDPPANQEQMLAASIQPIVAFMVLVSITVHGLSIPFFSRAYSHAPFHRAEKLISFPPFSWATSTLPSNLVASSDAGCNPGVGAADASYQPR